MSDKIIQFPGATTADIPADQVLHWATEAKLQDVIVIGWKRDGDEEFYAATSGGSVGDNLLLLELAKRMMVDGLCE